MLCLKYHIISIKYEVSLPASVESLHRRVFPSREVSNLGSVSVEDTQVKSLSVQVFSGLLCEPALVRVWCLIFFAALMFKPPSWPRVPLNSTQYPQKDRNSLGYPQESHRKNMETYGRHPSEIHRKSMHSSSEMHRALLGHP